MSRNLGRGQTSARRGTDRRSPSWRRSAVAIAMISALVPSFVDARPASAINGGVTTSHPSVVTVRTKGTLQFKQSVFIPIVLGLNSATASLATAQNSGVPAAIATATSEYFLPI